jgi:tetratricopeptide (TPR) repeat protein
VRQALAAEQVKISTEQRVVIPRTTMLVLESEWDYQRFGLDRRALAAILTVGAGGIERMDRKTDAPPLPRLVESIPKPAPAPIRVEERINEVAKSASAGDGLGAVSGWMDLGAASQAAPVISGAPSFDSITEVTTAAPHRREERRSSDANWSKNEPPSKTEIAKLQAELKKTPGDRELYNQLSEALAASGDWSALRTLALAWQPYDPENPQVYEVLGLADEHLDNMAEAARANASIIEVAAAKPELLQRAGLLLLRDGRAALAEAPLRRALEIRPDRVNGYRHLAILLWREGRPEEAARVLESATRQQFPGWYGDAQRVVREELGYVYRAWLAKDPAKRGEIEDRAREHHVDLARRDALRVTLSWETDANDVDLHVIDPKGEECYYGHRATATGLSLYEDITQGLGPEVIRTDKLVQGRYDIGVRYFAAGPMGVSRGIVIVMRGDDTVDIRPFRLVEGGGEIRYLTSVSARPGERLSLATPGRSKP